VAVIQIALLGAMVVDRAQILRGGTEVKLQTRPIDPRDLLRGDYVVLGYDISTVASGALFKQPSASRHPVVYVKLAPKADGLYEAVSVHTAVVPVTSPEVLIRGTVAYGASCEPDGQSFCKELQIRYNLEKYFVPEGEGKKLEDARNQRKLTIVAAVLPSGRAAIKRLLLDGQPVYEEPWY
jgi:uncharacterized membrane-anchored protein